MVIGLLVLAHMPYDRRPAHRSEGSHAGREAPVLPVVKRSSALRPLSPMKARGSIGGRNAAPRRQALASIRIADRRFDAVLFVRGAVMAYEAVLAAFAEGTYAYWPILP